MQNLEIIVTLLTLLGTIVLLVSNVVRNDVVAILIILALMIGGVLDVPEALSGFSSPAVIIIASMFIIGLGITNTGLASRAGDIIIKYGGSNEKRLLAVLMLMVALVGSFMSSTATTAIFIPITLMVAEKAGLNHRRLLMPLSIAALISGMMTLVATTPNIVVNGILRQHGQTELGFFSFTPFGISILLVAIAFMLTLGGRLLDAQKTASSLKKDPGIDDLLRYHNIDKHMYLLRVMPGSSLIHRSVATAQLNLKHHVILVAIKSHEGGRRRKIAYVGPDVVFREYDVLMTIGREEDVAGLVEEYSLQEEPFNTALRRSFFQVVGLAEVMLNPESSLIGKTLCEIQFQNTFRSMVLGIRRKGETLTEKVSQIPLKYGDVLLVCGTWKNITQLTGQREHYLLLTLPKDYNEVIPASNKANIALLILAGMVSLIAFNLLPPVAAIIAACVALVISRCVPVTSVYSSIDWQTVIMLAGIMSLALALQKTGLISMVSSEFTAIFSGLNPIWVLGGLFLLTSLLCLVITNSAVAALVAPMAVDIGLKLDIAPQACVMVVALSCSAAFMSPFGAPTNMIVRGPGGYGLKDFLKVGMPLLGIALCITLAICWVVYL